MLHSPLALFTATALASLALPTHASAQCTPQDLQVPSGNVLRLSVHGDTLGVATDDHWIHLFSWGGTEWSLSDSIEIGPGYIRPSFPNQWSFTVSEDLVLVSGSVHGGFGAVISERENGVFTPFIQLVNGASFPSEDDSYRTSAFISSDGQQIELGIAAYNSSSGIVILYERSATEWVQTGNRTLPFTQGLNFGGVLAGNDDHLLVSATSGVVASQVAVWSGTSVALLTQGVGINEGWGTFLGVSGAPDGDLAIVGGTSGSAFPVEMFRYLGGTWTAAGGLVAPPSWSGQELSSLDLRGTRLVIGCTALNRVFEYNIESGVATLVASREGVAGFGVSVARTPLGTAVSAAAVTQAFPEDVWIRSVCPCVAPSCGNSSATGGCVNAVGTSATIRGCGTTSTGRDDLVLHVAGLTPNTWGTVFMGRIASTTPLGNGLLCLGGSLYRFMPEQAIGTSMDLTGLVTFSQANHPANARISAGQTWSFQSWYRDVGGPCGQTSNFTNALTVTFRP